MRQRQGSIDVTADGKFRLRVTGDQGRKTVGIFESREEAESVRRAVIQIIANEKDARHTLTIGTADTLQLISEPSKSISIREFSTVIKVREGTIRKWISDGMPVVGTGKSVRIVPEDACKWIDEFRKHTIAIGRRSVVYFIMREVDNAIKIGWTSSVERRLYELRRVEKTNVELLAAYPGDMKEERRLHNHFSRFRLHGEWFRPDPKLVDYISNIGKSVECPPI